ncbi:hypothetical protein NA56DRAFT_707211 [Hyaloscypha hepaticicola]|uniref:Uncharacterized protein n=1 Tax=Hyaloscypha hepaticicola TaxID=2082293 RepID=A0A2J6PUW8_9HELO|nr:hypothetical protein NA56DRAFT_707211 [Hyaloscypha hepaticicola]
MGLHATRRCIQTTEARKHDTQQLYTLFEIAMLEQCIGDEIDWDAAQKRLSSLPWEIWQLIQQTYLRVHKKKAEYIWILAKEEGASSHVVMFDHFQLWFNEAVCDRNAHLLKQNPVGEFWEETDGEV